MMSTGYIAISYICNQFCSFCPCSKAERKYPFTLLDDLKKTVDEMIVSSCIDSIVVSGGEPTLHPEFIPFIRYLNEKGLKVTILSNAERFDDDRLIANFVKSVAIDKVNVITTIHSQLRDQHESINGSVGSFTRTVNGLKKLVGNGVHVTVKHCLTRLNYKDLTEFYRFIDSEFDQAVDIQLCSIDYCGLTDENKYDHMVVFPDLAEYMENMFDAYISDKEKGSSRKLYCINMPLCSCDPYYWDYFAQKSEGYSGYSAPTSEGKSSYSENSEKNVGTFGISCKECLAESICAGTYYTAFKYFGDSIIKKYEK